MSLALAGRGSLSAITVVIPAYNEELAIGQVVHAVRSLGLIVLVCNDASTDATAQEAMKAGAQVLDLPCTMGAWGATQAGIRHALCLKSQIIITMDADGQHMPQDIPALLEPLNAQRADIVIASCTQRGSGARHLAWWMFRFITGLKVRDLTSGFRAYNRKAARSMLRTEALLVDFQDIGILLLARRRNLHIEEIQSHMQKRKAGKSRIFCSWFRVAYYMLYTFILAITRR